MPFFNQQKVWHSFIKSRSPMVMRFKNPPLVSQYKDDDGNYPWIIYFQVRGDDPGTDYYYAIESEDILEQLRALDYGQWYSVTASGGPDGQTLDIQTASASQEDDAVKGGGGGSSKQQYHSESLSTGYIVGDYMRCVEEAKGVARDIGAQDPAITQAIAATLYINWSKTGFRAPLSAEDAPDREYTDEEPEADLSAEVAGLIDQLPKRTGKAHDGKALKTAIGNIEKALNDPSMLSGEGFGQVIKWLAKEVEYQTPEEEAEYSDDLPF